MVSHCCVNFHELIEDSNINIRIGSSSTSSTRAITDRDLLTGLGSDTRST